MKNYLFRQNGETHIPYGTLQSGLEAEVSRTLSIDENSVTFSKEYCLTRLSSVRKITLEQNRSIQVNGRMTVSSGRKPFMLEAEGSSTLF
jgi:hypothetical protein